MSVEVRSGEERRTLRPQTTPTTDNCPLALTESNGRFPFSDASGASRERAITWSAQERAGCALLNDVLIPSLPLLPVFIQTTSAWRNPPYPLPRYRPPSPTPSLPQDGLHQPRTVTTSMVPQPPRMPVRSVCRLSTMRRSLGAVPV